MQRFRIQYSKNGALRYTGNLDMQKVWERYLRRAELPVAYSQGFHPQARIQQACPLPLGFLSQAEVVDVWLDDDQISAQEVTSKLTTVGQPGIEITQIHQTLINGQALQSAVESAEYVVELLETTDAATLKNQLDRLLSAPSVVRRRRDKSYDLRPLIETLTIQPATDSGQPILAMRLTARDGATGRPDEVLAELGINPNRTRITRTALLFN